MAAELHDLLRKVARPNRSDVDKELTFSVQQRAVGENGEGIRTISLNGNSDDAEEPAAAAKADGATP